MTLSDTIPITIKRITHTKFLKAKEKYKGEKLREDITHDDFLEHLLNSYKKNKNIDLYKPRIVNY